MAVGLALEHGFLAFTGLSGIGCGGRLVARGPGKADQQANNDYKDKGSSHRARIGRQGLAKYLLGGFARRFICSVARLDLRRLLLDEADDMVDHLLVADMMVGDAGQIDHMLALAAAGDADVGLARFARAIDDASEHAQRHRGPDVLQPLLQLFDSTDDVEARARTART